MTPADLTTVARHWLFVREQGPNRGAWVEFAQRFCHGVPGDSWCADILSVWLDVAYYGQSPLHRTGSCAAMLAEATEKRFTVNQPVVNGLYFYVNATGHAHHCGVVTGSEPLIGIAGNTTPDGVGDNGTGVYEHGIAAARCVFVALPK